MRRGMPMMGCFSANAVSFKKRLSTLDRNGNAIRDNIIVWFEMNNGVVNLSSNASPVLFSLFSVPLVLRLSCATKLNNKQVETTIGQRYQKRKDTVFFKGNKFEFKI